MAIGNLLTSAEAAEQIGVSVRRLHQFVKEERLSPTEKVGNSLLFDRRTVLRFARTPRLPGRPRQRRKSA